MNSGWSAAILEEGIPGADLGDLVGGDVVEQDLLARCLRRLERAPEREHDRAVAGVVEATAAADAVDADDKGLVLDRPGAQQRAPVIAPRRGPVGDDHVAVGV